jgi:hypothetical protein
MSEGRIEPDPATPTGQQGSEHKGVGSLCFMTRGAASLSSIPMGTCCNRYRKLPRVEPAGTLTATSWSLQAPIAIRLH